VTVSTFAAHVLRGTLAARPAATDVQPGTLYVATDTGLVAQSDGAAWTAYAYVVPAGGSTGQVLTKTSGADGAYDWET